MSRLRELAVMSDELDHDHGNEFAEPSQAHHHEHYHLNGVWEFFRQTPGHSHTPHGRINSGPESDERGIQAVQLSLIGLGVTALIQIAIALASGSAGLLADTIHNFGDATTSIPLWIAFTLARRGGNRHFTYGYGRAEDVVGAMIVLVILISAIVAGFESIVKLIHPRPMGDLGWVAAAAMIGFLGNEAVGLYRVRIGREISSAALIADGEHSRVDGFTSLAVLIGVIGTVIGVPLLDPLVGIAISITILLIIWHTIKIVWSRLLGAIEPEILAAVEHAPLHVSGVDGVHQARAQWIGHRVLVDLHVSVSPALSVREAHTIVSQVESVLREQIPSFGGATIEVCPHTAAKCEPMAESTRKIFNDLRCPP